MSSNGNRTFVIGVGMTKFDKPGTKEGDYPDWAKEAGEKALADAGIPYDDVEQAYAGYCYGDSTYGQRARLPARPDRDPGRQRQQQLLDRLLGALPRAPGGQGRPRRLRARARLREDGEGLARREVHRPHERRSTSTAAAMFEVREPEESPSAPQMFGNAGRDHMEKYGSEPDHYAWIGWKNHKHSVNNPYAQFQDEYTLEEIKDARMIHEPLTKLQCSPTSDGSACAIVASERFVDEHDLWDQAVEIAGQAMVTDLSSTFDDDTDCIKIVGYDMSKEAADQAYEEAGISADGRRRLRAARLLLGQRADHLRGARLRRGGRGPQARRGRGDDLRRRRPGGQPVGRPDLEGPPARRDRARPVLRAHLAAARRRPTSARSTAPRSRSSTTSASAAPRSSRSTSLRRPEEAADEHDHEVPAHDAG